MFRVSTTLVLAAAWVACAHAAAPDPIVSGSAQRATWGPLAPPTPVAFRHDWTRTPLQHRVTQEDLANQELELKLYGPSGDQILTASAPAPSMTGGAPPHIFTGMCERTCALALRDRKNFVDLSGLGKIRWSVKVSGLHRIHPIIKLADGKWLIGEHADENRVDFNVSEFNLSETRWMELDIEKVITRGSLMDASKIDFSKVDEIGFTDLMPGSGHGDGGFSDVGWIEVVGKAVPRTGR
jgi:hypothetical protein